jgi:hypothetical protein
MFDAACRVTRRGILSALFDLHRYILAERCELPHGVRRYFLTEALHLKALRLRLRRQGSAYTWRIPALAILSFIQSFECELGYRILLYSAVRLHPWHQDIPLRMPNQAVKILPLKSSN